MRGDSTVDGLLVVDKPSGITSRAAVNRALSWFPRRTRLGHAGTLDPLATGVLLLCAGQATRLVEYVQRMGKSYHSLFRLGARSDTDDADGCITAVSAADPGQSKIKDILAGFKGVIEQTPPDYSAAKVAGRRAYDLARQGEEIDFGPRAVRIDSIEIVRYEYPEVEVVVNCGKGTYIRSLARDLGEKLGCGAYVQTLRRLSIGPFTLARAVSLNVDARAARAHLLPLSLAVAELPRLVLPGREREMLKNGQSLPLSAAGVNEQKEIAVLDESGELAAIVEVDREQGRLRPVKVFKKREGD
jgi:tRNA pseudouridine55 synthase